MEIDTKQITIRRVGNPAWKKGGASPNPGGRPKKLEALTMHCREMTPQILETVESILLDEKARNADRLNAARLLLEYGYGKPSQQVRVMPERPEFDVSQMTEEELQAALERQRQIAEAIGTLRLEG